MAGSAATLLVRCTALGGSDRIGLVRHNKFRIAQVVVTELSLDICVLGVADTPLNAARGYRNGADLVPGEPVHAIANRTGRDFSLVNGRVTKALGTDTHLETDLVLPNGALSAVVFDRDGNLIGLAAPAPGDVTTVSPLTPPVASAANLHGQEAAPARSSKREVTERSAHAKPMLQATLVATQRLRPVLQLGDRLEARLWTSADAYAYCFHLDGDGRVSRVLPNRFQPDALVRAGIEIAIPGSGAGFEIIAERAGASEEVRCFAAESDPGPELPSELVSTDLTPLLVGSLSEVADAFRRHGADVIEITLPLRVAGGSPVTAALSPGM